MAHTCHICGRDFETKQGLGSHLRNRCSRDSTLRGDPDFETRGETRETLKSLRLKTLRLKTLTPAGSRRLSALENEVDELREMVALVGAVLAETLPCIPGFPGLNMREVHRTQALFRGER